MTIITKGMGAVIKNIFKPRGKKITTNEKMHIKSLARRIEKGVEDRNISSKELFKNMKKVEK